MATIFNKIKLDTMQNKWMQKRDSGNVLSKDEVEKRSNWSQEERMLHDFEEQMADNREAEKINKLDAKIEAGGNLTADEEKYLQEKNPAALERYKRAKKEKKAYEEKLKNCKTKDEVERLKTETIKAELSSFKKIENNPYISISDKLAKAKEMLAKVRNMEEAEIKFKLSSAYDNLPTEAEEAEERAKERETALEKSEENKKENIEENKEDNNEEILKKDLVKESKKVDNPIDEIEAAFNRVKFSFELEQKLEKKSNFQEKSTSSKVDFSV